MIESRYVWLDQGHVQKKLVFYPTLLGATVKVYAAGHAKRLALAIYRCFAVNNQHLRPLPHAKQKKHE